MDVFEELFDLYDRECEEWLETSLSETSFAHLTFNHYQYLKAIDDLGCPTLSSLSEYLKVSNASTSAMINKLIHERLVVKYQSEKDKRSYYVKLSDLGNQIIRMEKKSFLLVTTRLVENLGKEQQKELLFLLRQGLDSVKSN
ncbi:hypothetical protein SANA_14320 [Gottschalkiaceae bacterium SANA]|nr:hypothetical protein SANA_14320 [Gottschalkiaceae bacterium SANA]